ncbi:MAG: hypothetical protein KKA76_13000, partial [Proteobacteria bacterium]|nr:hypothetical protein [Pseudomonadota bacterium]
TAGPPTAKGPTATSKPWSGTASSYAKGTASEAAIFTKPGIADFRFRTSQFLLKIIARRSKPAM